MTITTRTAANGRVFVDDGNLSLVPQAIYVLIHPQVGLIQLGNGEKYVKPATLNKVGAKAAYIVGDYEIEIRRVTKKKLARNGIINLAEARKEKAEA